jgi:hypothetical protein
MILKGMSDDLVEWKLRGSKRVRRPMFTCKQCGATWKSRPRTWKNILSGPRQCPRCGSRLWGRLETIFVYEYR